MYRIFRVCIVIILSFISIESLFAAGCDIKADLPTTSELTTDIARCITARGS